MIKISKPSKMKIHNKKVGCWSLEARVSCPGSIDSDGKIVEVCKSCYASKGMYRFPNTKAVRQHNKQDYQRDDWVNDMIKEVSKYDYFRWFDSGDIESPELALKMQKVISGTPNVKHWIPTRSDKSVGLLGRYIDSIHKYNRNAAVRPSADKIGLNNEERPGIKSYVINKEDIFEAKRQGIHVCPVGIEPDRKSCDTCTMCYTDAKVAYVLH